MTAIKTTGWLLGTVVLDPDGAFTYYSHFPTSQASIPSNTWRTTALRRQCRYSDNCYNGSERPTVCSSGSYAVAQDTLLIVPTAQSLLANDEILKGMYSRRSRPTEPGQPHAPILRRNRGVSLPA